MRLCILFTLTLAAFAAEAPTPKPAPTKEETLSKRIVELERENAIAVTRAIRAKWEHFASEAARLDGEWKTAAQKACKLQGIPAEECHWINDTIARLPAPAPAAKPAAPTKGK